MAEEPLYDVAIIGGGPAGAAAALYASRAELKTLVLDKAIRMGALGLTSKIANYPGIKEIISGEELVQRMREHAEQYGARFQKAKVAGSLLTQDPKQLFTAEGGTILARTVILATGSMGRSQTVPGETELLGRGVSYCATCDGAFFKAREVLVYGSNQETADEALFLTRFASHVHLASPKAKMDADPHTQQQLEASGKVTLIANTRLKSIIGETSVREAVLVKPSGEEHLPIAGVFIFLQGGKPILDFVAGQVELLPNGYVRVNEEMRTSVPGVFACGDLVSKEVQQAVVAAAHGCIAALAADKYIHKRSGMLKDYQ